MLQLTKYHFYLCFCFLLGNIYSYSQHENDTPVDFNDQKIDTAKVNTLLRLCAAMYYKDIDKSLEYAQKAFDFAKKIDYTEGIDMGNQYLANCYIIKSDYKEVAKCFNFSLRLHDSLKNFDEMVKDLVDLGFLHKSLGNFSNALDYLEKSLTYKDSIKDKSCVTLALENIGATLYECQKYQESLDFYLRSLDTIKKYSSEDLYSTVLSNIGSCFTTLNQPDSALKYSNLSLKIANKLPESQQRGHIFRQHGYIYEGKNDSQKALQYYFKALDLDKKYSTDLEMANDLLAIGDIYGKSNTDKALKYYQEGLMYAKRIDAKYMQWIFYQDIYNLYAKEQNYKEALNNYILYTEVDKMIFNDESNKQITQLSIKYEAEKREREIIQKNDEIKLLQQEKRISNLKKLIVITCLSILLIAGTIMLFYLRRFYKSQKESLDEEIKFKNAELTNFAISISNNLKFNENLKENIRTLKKHLKDPLNIQQLDYIEKQILIKLQVEKDKNEFNDKVEDSYKSFYDNLEKSFPKLSKNEKQLAAFLRINLSTKEIATLFNSSTKNIEMGRYRLRKKLNITRDENLASFLNQF